MRITMQKIRLQILVNYETLQSLHEIMEKGHYVNLSQAIASVFRGYDTLLKRYNAVCTQSAILEKQIRTNQHSLEVKK